MGCSISARQVNDPIEKAILVQESRNDDQNVELQVEIHKEVPTGVGTKLPTPNGVKEITFTEIPALQLEKVHEESSLTQPPLLQMTSCPPPKAGRFIEADNSHQIFSPRARVNLIDVLKERSRTKNDSSSLASEPDIVTPTKKTDLIELVRSKRQVSGRSRVNLMLQRQSVLLKGLDHQIKEEPYEQSSLSNVLLDPPPRKDTISAISTFSKDHIFEDTEGDDRRIKEFSMINNSYKEVEPMKDLSMSYNASFMVGGDDMTKLNFDKYSFRVETMQVSFEQLQSRSARSNKSYVEAEPILTEEALFLRPPPKSVPLRKTLSSNVYLSPRDNYLTPYSQTYRSTTPRPGTQVRPVLETDKMMKSFDESGNKKINDYVVIGNIGRGGFGKVKKVFTSKTKQIYAMKVANKEKLRKKMLSRTKSAFTFLEQEVAIMKKMDHPNIVTLQEVIDDPDNDKLYLIMDFIDHGAVNSKTYWTHTDISKVDVDGSLIGTPTIPHDRLLRYFRDFIMGLHYIHNVANVVHRDIKPDNLLIDKYDTLKIADFGVAQIIDQSDEVAGSAGTKAFLPPEAFENRNFNGKSADIWAAGVCFFFLAVGVLPFKAIKLEELKHAVLHCDPVFPEGMNPQLQDLLQQCLMKPTNQRITLEGMMNHPWVTENGQHILLSQDDEVQHLVISDMDIKAALSGLTLRSKVRITAKLRDRLEQSRKRLKSKNSFTQL